MKSKEDKSHGISQSPPSVVYTLVTERPNGPATTSKPLPCGMSTDDKESVSTASLTSASNHDCDDSGSDASSFNRSQNVGTSGKLGELRAWKAKRELDLKNLMAEKRENVLSPPDVEAPNVSAAYSREELIEPVVYDDLREELLAAYELIQIQQKVISNQKNGLDVGKENPVRIASPVNCSSQGVGTQVSVIELENTKNELILRNCLTRQSTEYKKTIQHWKREANSWKNRFESSWDDHRAQISRLEQEKREMQARARAAEEKLANFKSGSSEMMSEIVQAKARNHALEEYIQKLNPQVPIETILVPPDTSGQEKLKRALFLEDTMKCGGAVVQNKENLNKTNNSQALFLEDVMKRSNSNSNRGRFSWKRQ